MLTTIVSVPTIEYARKQPLWYLAKMINDFRGMLARDKLSASRKKILADSILVLQDAIREKVQNSDF